MTSVQQPNAHPDPEKAKAQVDSHALEAEPRKLSSERSDSQVGIEDKDAEFGGTEERKRLEKKFLLKLDLRMSILILIYILNYVSFSHISPEIPLIIHRSTETMQRELGFCSQYCSQGSSFLSSAARLRGFEEDLNLKG
jgi:hypothetical protein